MDGITEYTPTNLPYDLIESILSRLPVKSLLRFKAVCKQWNATISDPIFAEIHARQSKTSSSPCLIEGDVINSVKRARIVDFGNDEVRVLSAVDYPPLTSAGSILCHCDGLYLISRHQNEYVLWNPSRRRRRELCCPHPFDRRSSLIFGICYDPLVKDYKVLIGDGKSYAVFYCRHNCWSERQSMTVSCFSSSEPRCRNGVPLNGSIYWVCLSRAENRFQIVYFDGRDEKFKNLCKVDRRAQYADLVSSADSLYLSHRGAGLTNEFQYIERVGVGDDISMELKVQVPFARYYMNPLCWTHQNMIIFHVFCPYGRKNRLYNPRKKIFRRNSDCCFGFKVY